MVDLRKMFGGYCWTVFWVLLHLLKLLQYSELRLALHCA